MRLISISLDPTRVQIQRKIWPDLEVFEATGGCTSDYRIVCIPKTYKRLAAHAVKHKWGRETVVAQDDVWPPHGPGFEAWQRSFQVPLLIFGQRETPTAVAPKAFSADRAIWKRLKQVWDGKARVIPAWMPIVDNYGLVLDVTRELGGTGRHAPCRGCGH
jgi:hypothetical protein